MMMTLAIATEPLPLSNDAEGTVRVGGTRVTLDTVVDCFNDGATPEEIVLQYPTLQLSDVYAVVSYYLRHRQEVDRFIDARQQRAAEVRRENEARFPSQGIRERLLSRRQG